MKSAAYLFVSPDSFTLSAKVKELVAQLLPATDQDLGLEIVAGDVETIDAAAAAARSCLDAVATVGFLSGGRKVVWFKDATFLSGKTMSAPSVRVSLDGLADMVRAGLPEGQALIVTAPEADGRSAFCKAFAEGGTVWTPEPAAKPAVAREQARARLAELLRGEGLKAGADVIDRILDKAGTDTAQLASEATKLAAYAGDRKDVSTDDVDAIVSTARGVPAWDLADAVGRKDLALALRLVRQLLFQRTPAMMLIATVNGRIRDLIVLNSALENGWLRLSGSGAQWANVPPDAEVVLSGVSERDPRQTNPYRLKLLAGQARGFSSTELQRCQQVVQSCHERLLTSSMPEQLVLELMLIRMLRRR